MSEDTSTALTLPANVNPNALFMLWQHLGGDDKRTAAAAGVDVRIVVALAHDFHWRDLAQGRLGLKDEKLEKEVNRAHNYVQSQRIRKVIDKTLEELESDPTTLRAALISVDEEGNRKFSAKPLVELAKAAEAVHNMAYRALGDKVANDADTTDAPDSEKIRNLSLTINALVTKASDAITNPVKTASSVKDAINI